MVCGDMNSGCKTIEHNEDKWSMRLTEIVKGAQLRYSHFYSPPKKYQ